MLAPAIDLDMFGGLIYRDRELFRAEEPTSPTSRLREEITAILVADSPPRRPQALNCNIAAFNVWQDRNEPGPVRQPAFTSEKQTFGPDSSKFKRGAMPTNAQTVDPLAEFDEYGTELHSDARVWKVYVKETDKYDTDLVKGWNDSTDVILIFAALFSAISTAFLIESSKLLQQDPADVSVQTLVAISQTLLTIANGTQTPGSIPSPETPSDFTPTRTAVWINALWFLSLSLSLATSFIAILAKDWCHSFMAGRTGHPYSQTYRRQKKWDMIEKWGMSELLTILPSLIHVALLLFSFGLCVYVWETHIFVAIPVICVTAIAICFYIWSSAAAIILDYFPYPTIVSRLYRTQVTRRVVSLASRLGSQLAAYPLVRIAYQAILFCILPIIRVARWALLGFNYLWLLLVLTEVPLDKCDELARRSHPSLQLVLIPLLRFLRFFVWQPINKVWDWTDDIVDYLGLIANWIMFRLSRANWTLEWAELDSKPALQGSGYNAEQGSVASLALSWLITNCEVPESVDIALQSIAGATNRIPRLPLLRSSATLRILRRIASSKLYRETDVKAERIVSLYSRALAFLADSSPDSMGTELEGLIWDLHIEAEKRVVAMIVGGRFKLTQSNLDALRIGNTAASTSLKMFKKDSQYTESNTNRLFGSIIALLESHLNEVDTLHEAALLSLIHATTLLSLFAPKSLAMSTIPLLCARLVGLGSRSAIPHAQLTASLAITCVLSFNKLTEDAFDWPKSQFWLKQVVEGLVERYTQDQKTLQMVSTFGLEVLGMPQKSPHPEGLDPQIRQILLGQTTTSVDASLEDFWNTFKSESKIKIQEEVGFSYLRVLHSTYNLMPVGSAWSCIPFFATTVLSRVLHLLYSPFWGDCDRLTTRCRFPTLSPVLVSTLEERNVIPRLEKMINGSRDVEKFVATGQLWLLYTLYLDSSADTGDTRNRLGAQLRRYDASNPESEIDRHSSLGEQIEQEWIKKSWYTWGPLKGWTARLLECVLQSRNAPLLELVHERVRDTPQELRGLASFTLWRPQTIDSSTAEVIKATGDPGDPKLPGDQLGTTELERLGARDDNHEIVSGRNEGGTGGRDPANHPRNAWEDASIVLPELQRDEIKGSDYEVKGPQVPSENETRGVVDSHVSIDIHTSK